VQRDLLPHLLIHSGTPASGVMAPVRVMSSWEA
jgi:hypothetical protein